MTIYRDIPEISGAVGDPVSAADIDMNTKVGTITVVEPGWTGTKAWEYDVDSYTIKTGTFASQMFEKTAIKIETPPVGVPCRFYRLKTAGGTAVINLQMETDGRITLYRSGSANETTRETYHGVWLPRIMEFDQDSGECIVRLYNRLEELQETLRITVGANTIGIIEEGPGAIDTGTGMKMTVAETNLRTDPVVIPLDRPNIVYIVMDDAPAQAYMKRMETVNSMMANGAVLSRHYVANPLCAPSRANMITGQYGQNNGVNGNGGATTDWLAFSPHNERYSLYARMSDIGYRTLHAGKFLHNYDPHGNDSDHGSAWKPKGCNWGLITAGGYQGFDYEVTDNRDGDASVVDTTGGLVHNPPASDYFTDRMSRFVEDFVDDHDARYSNVPFLMLLAPFAGHNNVGGTDPEDPNGPSYPPAPRDRVKGPNWPAGWPDPDDPVNGDLGFDPPDGIPDYQWEEQSTNWNTQPTPTPGWMSGGSRSPSELAEEEARYLDVVRQMQAVDDLIIDLKAQLASYGMLDNTIFMVTSDNGYDRGEHGLPGGKGTPYDQACRLPLVIEGPGVTAGLFVDNVITQNIDILPTCLEIAGIASDTAGMTADDVDGSSFWGFVHEGTTAPVDWRKTALVQYTSGDVDSWEDAIGGDEPPDWFALFNETDRYITYLTTDPSSPPESNRGEAYHLVDDPGMINNLYPELATFRAYPIQALLQLLLFTAGAESREAQRQVFTLGLGDSAAIEGVVYSIRQEGSVEWLDLADSAGRFILSTETKGSQLPSVSYNDLETPYGIEVTPGFDPTRRSGPAYLTLVPAITSKDDQGREGGAVLHAENLTAIGFALDTWGTFVLGERPGPEQPVSWEAVTRRIGAMTPEGNPTTKLAPTLVQIPGGHWRSPGAYTWTVPFFGGTGDAPLYVTTLAGSSAPVRGSLLRIKGPMDGCGVQDLFSSYKMSWTDSVSLASNEWLLVDLGLSWIARRLTTDTWDLTAGTDESMFLDCTHGVADLLPLHPFAYNGNVYDRRVGVIITGAGRDESTTLSIRAYRTRRI